MDLVFENIVRNTDPPNLARLTCSLWVVLETHYKSTNHLAQETRSSVPERKKDYGLFLKNNIFKKV
jgi:hypothetical protein